MFEPRNFSLCNLKEEKKKTMLIRTKIKFTTLIHIRSNFLRRYKDCNLLMMCKMRTNQELRHLARLTTSELKINAKFKPNDESNNVECMECFAITG